MTLYSCNSHSTNNLNIVNTNSIGNSNSNVISTLAKANKVSTTTKPSTAIASKKENSIVSFVISNWFILSEILVVIISKHRPSFFRSGGPLKPGII